MSYSSTEGDNTVEEAMIKPFWTDCTCMTHRMDKEIRMY